MKNIVILGSTGSIGTQTLDIIRKEKDYNVVGLSCFNNVDLLEKQIEEFRPKYVCLADSHVCARDTHVINKYKESVNFFYGTEGLESLASIEEADVVLNSLVGSVGLKPTLEAIKHNKKVLLANKETLVIGGILVKEALKKYNGTLYPIDSEHSSLWELIDEYGKENIDYITITASGGPFRDVEKEKLKDVTIEEALNNPNWKMGKKITIDSATMMNKGFEVIEAYYLFGFELDKIKTIINLESLVHSMIALKDGTTIKGIDKVTMENPIRRALYYPEIRYEKEDHNESEFHFREIDNEKYPCLELAYKALKYGGVNPAILNAANEASTYLFLNSKIKFTDIYRINCDVLEKFKSDKEPSLENILYYDKIIKEYVLRSY